MDDHEDIADVRKTLQSKPPGGYDKKFLRTYAL